MKKFLIILSFLVLPLMAEEPPQEKQTPPMEEQAPPMETTPKAKKAVAPEVQAKTDKYESAFTKTIFILISILVLVVLTVWMFKRLSNSRFSKLNYLKNIKILEKRPLSPKSMLYLVEVGEKQILLAESQIEIRSLGTFDWPDHDQTSSEPTSWKQGAK